MLDSIKTIIVATDFSAASEIAERSAVTLAARNGATIHLLHAIRLPFLHTTYDLNVPEIIWKGLRKESDEKMAEARQKLEKLGAAEVRELVSESLQPAEAVVQSARKLDADLIIMGTHGHRGLKHTMLGSVAERTTRISPVPVLSVKGYAISELPIQRILFATDFSSHSNHALSIAISFAKNFGVHLDVIHVLDEPPDFVRTLSAEIAAFEVKARSIAGERLEEIGARILREGLSVKTYLQKGSVVDVIVAEATRLRSNLIVMGTHGHTGFAHAALGSVAERTLRLSPCTVLTTRLDETAQH